MRALIFTTSLLLFGASLAIPDTVIINELGARSSHRLLRWDAGGTSRVGAGPSWNHPGFDDRNWDQGQASFGFGAGPATDLSASMQNQATSLYLRKTFTATAFQVAWPRAFNFKINYDDGFVAYLNGIELQRKNLGGAGMHVFYDQWAYDTHDASAQLNEWFNPPSAYLVEGENVLAIQVCNRSLTDNDLSIDASLELNASNQFVTFGDTWKYFVGVFEPSGGLIDTRFDPGVPVLNVEWGRVGFDDAGWSSGPGGLGFGDGDDATVVNIQNITPSLYLRQAFTVSAATAARADPVHFTVDYDDGFIAFLNGVEVARRNMGSPGEFFAREREATGDREAGNPITIELAAANLILQRGENVLAIQVHNSGLGGSDLSMIADLDILAAPAESLVAHADPWKYHPGVSEPALPPEPEAVTEPGFEDWVELVNTGAVAVSVSGWSLSDQGSNPTKWFLPDLSIDPGEHLIILCSGRDVRSGAGDYYHSNFKLNGDGERVRLYNASTQLVSDVEFPDQEFFYSWGRENGTYGFMDPTPGTSNGSLLTGRVDTPDFSHEPGFYDGVVSIVITTETAGATIRYTTDGSEPTLANGADYNGALNLNQSTALRARAFLAGAIDSRVRTRTYLVNEPAAFRNMTAISVVGDWERALHKPHGVTSIVGGSWSGTWSPTGPDSYNIPMQRGRPWERSASFEVLNFDSNPGTPAAWKQVDCGIRISGSNYTRPRYILQNMEGEWSSSAHVNKAQFNLFFRGDYGSGRFNFPLMGEDRVASFDRIRLRGGKNDWNNPFIVDELMRRLMISTGQVGARGFLACMWVNGEFRSYYNPAERYVQEFFQDWYHTDNSWDIINHSGLAEGDLDDWNATWAFLNANPISVLANYQQFQTMFDVENFADYLIVNTYGATWDWPQNNFYAARERSEKGRWRYYMWDAEGGMGFANRNPFGYDPFWSDLWPKNNSISNFFKALMNSPEWKMVFADRLYKHFFNGGGLETPNIQAEFDALATEMNPVMQEVRNTGVNTGIIQNWINNRRNPYLNQARGQGLWPTTMPPTYDQPGGEVNPGQEVAIANPNTAGQIYYTLDGRDPRAPGGGVAGTLYTAPVVIDRSRVLKARVFDLGSWSALAETAYLSDAPPIVVTELMYHPEGGDPFEYIEIRNVGDEEVSLIGLEFTEGVIFDFDFGSVSSLAPGAYAVVVADEIAFDLNYPGHTAAVAGAFSGQLDNNSERILLRHKQLGDVLDFSYDDDWYPQTDGGGFALAIVNDEADTSLWNRKSAWKASDWREGSPGGDEPGGVPLPGEVIISELLSNTLVSPVGDWVEIANTTTNDIPIGGWYLSDSDAELTRYRIPDGTVLPAGGYLVFNHLEHFGSAAATTPFAFSSKGDQVYLSSRTNHLGLTGFRAIEVFDGADPEVSFGSYLRSDGERDFTAMAATSRGSANGMPRVGPLVIRQIMYHPQPSAVEYLVIYNVSPDAVPLYDPAHPTNVWQLVDGVTFDFPSGISIEPYSCAIVTEMAPADFRANYGIPANIEIFGPWSGALGNGGDSVRLYKPGWPDGAIVPRIRVDRVDYDDAPPWPLEPDGNGPSLVRVLAGRHGNDPINWMTGPAAGLPDLCVNLDSEGDGMPDKWESQAGLDPLDAADGASDEDLDLLTALQEFFAGTDPNDANARFELELLFEQGGWNIRCPTIEAGGDAYTGMERVYSLEWMNDANGTWLPVPGFTDILGQGQLLDYAIPANESFGAYRGSVRLRQQ